MTEENKIYCGNCIYFKRQSIVNGGTGKNGICRQRPPITCVIGMTAQGPSIATVWPTVIETECCGCHVLDTSID